jgi:hypothetical protein
MLQFNNVTPTHLTGFNGAGERVTTRESVLMRAAGGA